MDEERCAGSRVSVMKNSPKARFRSFLPGLPSCVCARARLLHLVTTLDVHRRVASLHRNALPSLINSMHWTSHDAVVSSCVQGGTTAYL